MKGSITMKTITCIGEALIDFIPNKKGSALKDVEGFTRMAGGAPANVAAAAAKLGGKSRMLTKLGSDAFGDHIIEVLSEAGVDTSLILRTDKANTSLAFVSLREDGNRDFSFYRNPGADMLLYKEEIPDSLFKESGILHFCSVDLIEAPVKYAHARAIKLALESNSIISFDPNIRLPLWDNPEICRNTVKSFIPYAHIIKISDEELEFITGTSDVYKAAEGFFDMNAKMLLYSKGKDGAELITPDFIARVPSHPLKPVDTTGAGDSITGAFLYKLAEADFDADTRITEDQAEEFLEFASYYAEYGILNHGAIASYADMDQIQAFISGMKEGHIK